MQACNFYEKIHYLSSGCLYICDTATLVVSDMHLGKAASMARNGCLVPPYDAHDTLERLEHEINAHRPSRIIALGDSFDTAQAHDALPESVHDKLVNLVDAYNVIWITGNHDPVLSTTLGDKITDEFVENGVIFRHIAGDNVPGNRLEISGHYHPKANVSVRGRSIRRPCFIADDRRIIMPAFGAYTGGLDVNAVTSKITFDRSTMIYICGRSKIYADSVRDSAV
jgi:hypothetical protein